MMIRDSRLKKLGKLWMSSWRNIPDDAVAAAKFVVRAGKAGVGSRIFSFFNSAISSGSMGINMLMMLLTTAVATGSIVYSTSLGADSPMRVLASDPGQPPAVLDMLHVFVDPASNIPLGTPVPTPVEPPVTPAQPPGQNQAALSIIDPGVKTFGDASFTLSTNGGSGTGGITFLCSDGDVLSVGSNTGIVFIEGAGTATITATKAGDDNYNETTATLTITVGTRSMDHVTFTVSRNHIYDGLEKSPDLSVTDGPNNLISTGDYTVSYSGSRTNAGTFTVTLTGQRNYHGLKTQTVTIDPRELTLGFTAENKVYDGNLTATIAGRSFASGFVNGDDVTINGGTAVFADSNISTDIPVTASGFTLGGGDAGNYIIDTIDPATADIFARPVTVTGVTAVDRVFDNTLIVRLSGGSLENTIAGDDVGFTLHGGTTANANAGDGKPVTPNVVTLTGSSAGNYTLIQPDYTITVNITPKSITITPDDGQSKVRHNTGDPTFTFTANPALLGDDTFTGALGREPGETVAAYAYTLGSLSAGSNYTLILNGNKTFAITKTVPAYDVPSGLTAIYGQTLNDVCLDAFPGWEWDEPGNAVGYSGARLHSATFTPTDTDNYNTVTLNITVSVGKAVQAPLTGTDAIDKTYGDVPFGLGIGGGSGTGLLSYVSSDTTVINVSSLGMVTVEGAGSADITVTKAGDNNHYETGAVINVTVGKRDFSLVTITAPAPVTYNGLAHTPAPSVTDGDPSRVAAADYTVSYSNNTDRGTATITILPAVGGNYTGAARTVDFTISPRALILGFTAGNKIYDGSTTATILTSYINSGLVASDGGNVTVVHSTATATFDNKNVNTNKTVATSGFTLAGTRAGNYTIGTINTTTADITAKPITVTGVTAVDRVFNNTILVTLTGGILENTIALDNIGFALHGGTMADPNVGTGKTVTANVITLTGTDAGNYVLTQPDYAITVDITPRSVTITPVSGQSKIYDTPDPVFTFTASPSLLGSDTFTGSLGRTAGDDVGTYTLNIGSLGASSNYTLTFSGGAVFTIIRAAGDFGTPAAIDTTYTTTLTLGDLTPYLPAGYVWSAAGTALSGGSGQRFPAVFTCPSGNYMPVNGYITVNVARADQSALTINDPGTKTYGESGFTLTTTGGTTGGTVTFERISGNSLSIGSTGYAGIERAGITVVRAMMAGNGNYNDVYSAGLTITVGKRDMSNVSIGSITGMIYNGSPQNPVPVVTDNPSAGNLIAPGDWEIDTSWGTGGYLNNINAGEAEFRIRATSDGNYTGTADSTFMIRKATLTVSADDIGIEFGEETPELTYTITDFLGGDTMTAVTGTPLLTTIYEQGDPRGNYDILITRGTLAADNYDFYFYNGTLIVGVASQEPLTLVTSDGETTYVYGTTGISLVVEGGTTGGLITYTVPYGHNVVDVSNDGELLILSAGNATVRATMAGNDDYKPVYEELYLIITPKPLTADMININSVTYNGSAQTPVITVTDGLLPLIHSSDYSWTFTPQTNANTDGYDIVVEGKGNYGGSVTVQFIIRRVALTIAANDKEIAFGGSLPVFSADYRGFVDADSPETYGFTGSLSFDTDYAGIVIGSYYIRPYGLTSPNYDITYVDGVLTVIKAAGNFGTPAAVDTAYTPTLTLGDLSLPAGYVWNEPSTPLSIGTDTFAATYTHPSGNYEPVYGYITVNVGKVPGIATTDEVTVTYSPTLTVADAVAAHITGGYSFADAGLSLNVSDSPKIVTGYKDNADPLYYEYDSVTVTITVDPMSIEGSAVSIAGASFVYSGSAFEPAVYVTLVDIGELTAADFDIAYSNNTGAGTATVFVTGKDNYTGTASIDFTIDKANQPAIGVTGIPGTVTYGDSPITLDITGGAGTGAVTYLVTSGNATVSGSQLTITGAGSITVTAEKAGDANHNVSNTFTQTFTVSPKSLTWNTGATVNNKVYDGNSNAVVAIHPTLNGIAGSDVVTVTAGTLTFANANAGTHEVTASGWGIGGANAANYTAPAEQPVFTAANITARPLTWNTAGRVATTKVYDRTTDTTVNTQPGLTGVLAGDTATVTVVAGTTVYSSMNVGTSIPITATGWGISGSSAGNYTISGQPVFPNAAITARALTITGVTATSRAYNRATTVTTSGGTLSGVYTGDTVTHTHGAGNMANANVGTGKAVTTAITLSGAQAGNYTLTQPSGVTVNITAIQLTWNRGSTTNAAAVNNKVYDRTNAATVPTASAPTLAGVLAGDTVNVNAGTVTFNSVNVANGIAITRSGWGITGTHAANYLAPTAQPTFANANITARALTINFTASNKEFDGNNTATISGRSIATGGVLTGDTVTVAGGTATFNNATVGNGKTVTGTGFTLGGASAANYSVGTINTTTANITTKALTVSSTAVSRTLTPLTGELTATFTLTISGLPTGETITAGWGTWTGVTLTGNANLGNGTHTLTITYNGTATMATAANTRTLTSSSTNYTFSHNVVVTIRDGREAGARAIPVSNTSFQNFGTFARTTDGRSRHYFLTGNVTLTGTGNWTPINNFSGTFNGNGYTINGMNMNIAGTGAAGMFAYISSTGVVRNLGLTNVNIQGGEEAGGIAADLAGTIENCWVTGTVTAREYFAGGIAAHVNEGAIRNCYTTATVSGRRTYSEAGGIAGRLYSNSTAAGSGLIENCYSSSNVTGRDIGGIAGYAQGRATIRNSVALNGTLTGDYIGRITHLAGANATLTNNHARNGLNPTTGAATNSINGATMAAGRQNEATFWSGLGWNTTSIWTATAPPTLRAPSPLASSAPIDFYLDDIFFITDEEEPEDEEPEEEEPEDEPEEKPIEEEPEDEPDDKPEEETPEKEPEDEPEEEEPEDNTGDDPGGSADDVTVDDPPESTEHHNLSDETAYALYKGDEVNVRRSFNIWSGQLIVIIAGSAVIAACKIINIKLRRRKAK